MGRGNAERQRQRQRQDFQERLRALRGRKELTQEKLAEHSDLHPDTVGKLERGERSPRLTSILSLAIGLDVRPAQFFENP